MSEKELHHVSAERVVTEVRAYGAHKRLAIDLGLTDVELSRLINDHLPKFCALLSQLNLEIVPHGHVQDLRAVLKAIL